MKEEKTTPLRQRMIEDILTDPVVEQIRKKNQLAAINTLDETRHARLRLTC